MNYVAQAQRPNPVAILGAIGVPAAFGALLVTGLAVTAVITNDDGRTEGFNVPLPPPPKPTPTPDPIEIPEPTDQSQSVITAPDSPFDMNNDPVLPADPMPPADPLPPGPTPGTGNGAGPAPGPSSQPTPTPPPKFTPVSASPRGNPGMWVRNSDYRTSWIRREMTGTASFSLQISASGRVTGCTITRSTGHSALDQATCRLVSKRAKFTPARDDKGAVTSGNYSNSVTWRLPE